MSATAQATVDPAGLPQVPWWLIVGLGVLSIIVSILAVVWPDATLLLIALTFGIYLIAAGVGDLVGAFRIEQAGVAARIFFGLLGLLALVAGVILIARPEQSLLTAAWVLGLWFAVTGVVQVVQGLASSEGRVYNILLGLIGLVVGVIVLVQPSVGIVTLIWIVAIGFFLRGLLAISIGLLVRKASQ